jgi:hypothetical protein
VSAWKTATLCAACQARRDSADGHTREYAARTTPEAPDVLADRDHHIRITVWAACMGCSGRTR